MTSRSSLAGRIDHTLLKPEATDEQVAALVVEAVELGVFAVCLSPSRLPLGVLRGVQVCTVIGFPSGAHASEVKAAETRRAVRDGAQEVDMVVDLGRVKAGDFEAVEADVAAVVAASGPDTLVKVIVESAALTRSELVEACRASERGGAQYVKTSTGFHPAGGASVEAVRLMAETVDGRLGVKASGGIRDTATARAMLDAGATRLGLSGSRAVLDGLGPDT
jgi:deoxyribose-phosphate aldolase